MNKNEFIEFSAKLGKLLGAKPTMDNYTFSDPKSPVFQIKEKELRSVVRKAKALKDKEAHGIDDIEWDFEEGYIAFMLPGGFALYLSTEADMEMSEANEANEANTVNEAVDEKQFFKEFAKATDLKVGRDSELHDGNTGLVAIDAYTAARLRYGWVKPGKYGDFVIKSTKPIGYSDFEVVIGYDNEDYTLRFDSIGSPRTSADKAKPIADLLLDHARAKPVAMGKLRTYWVTDVDAATYNRLKSLKVGSSFGKRIGEYIITEVGKNPNGVFGGSPFIVEAVYPKGFVELVFRNADALEELRNDAKNLSSEMSESSNAELLKLAKSAAKTLGIKFKETPSSYKALMGASFEITEKDFIKIVNAFKRAQSDPAELGFYDMTFDNHEMDVLIDFEDYDDSILFYVGGMNEANAVNEATNTLNEASEARMRNKARAIAKFFGIEIDETVGSFGFFASSAGIDKSSYDKIIKIINQTKDIEKKLGVNFVEVWSKVNSIRFNVYRSEDDIFFKLQGMNESVELNEVTGLPKHKTSVPSHML